MNITDIYRGFCEVFFVVRNCNVLLVYIDRSLIHSSLFANTTLSTTWRFTIVSWRTQVMYLLGGNAIRFS